MAKSKQNKRKGTTKVVRRDPLITRRNIQSFSKLGLNSATAIKPDKEFLKACKGHLNPLSEEAAGLKVPDANTSNTFTYRSFARNSMYLNGASFSNGVVIMPSLLNEITQYTTPGATNGVWTAPSAINNYANGLVTANAASMRLVSWGVRVYCTCPYTAADGYVIFATSTGALVAPFNEKITAAQNYQEYEVVPLKDLDHVWVSAADDSILSREYVSTGTTSAGNMGWTNLSIMLVPSSGIANAPVAGASVTYEIVKNWELIPNLGAITNTMSTPAAQEDPRVSSVVTRVKTKIGNVHPQQTHHKTILDHLGGAVSDLAGDAVGWALPRLSNRIFGSGRGGPRPMAIDVD